MPFPSLIIHPPFFPRYVTFMLGRGLPECVRVYLELISCFIYDRPPAGTRAPEMNRAVDCGSLFLLNNLDYGGGKTGAQDGCRLKTHCGCVEADKRCRSRLAPVAAAPGRPRPRHKWDGQLRSDSRHWRTPNLLQLFPVQRHPGTVCSLFPRTNSKLMLKQFGPRGSGTRPRRSAQPGNAPDSPRGFPRWTTGNHRMEQMLDSLKPP